ncbi:sirohydrochlorin chelatase [Spirillospora sp. NPDC047279]|uniref:sirohydrochlorin chelatase n=1 Tax=Spirillospora sp. NPDC047279 TaxID=3155478 RepID=UPI0033F65703
MRDPPVTSVSPPPMVAVAHGSKDPRAAATVAELLTAVRARRPDVPVLTSFLDHAPPNPVRVLDGLAQDGVDEAVVLPLLLTAAYHSKTDVPGVLNDVRTLHPRLSLRTAATLGPHPLLMAALERRLTEAGVEIGDPDTAVVLVSAGSSDPSANATIWGMAREWRGGAGPRGDGPPHPPERLRRGLGWRGVVPAFASAARPTPGEAVSALLDAGAPRVVVASYFLAPGYFADKVRREALAAGAEVVSPVLGAAPEIADLVLRRYDEARTEVRAAAAV